LPWKARNSPPAEKSAIRLQDVTYGLVPNSAFSESTIRLVIAKFKLLNR
jgi:hypothetical protein